MDAFRLSGAAASRSGPAFADDSTHRIRQVTG
jgi:hypothetical protein